MEVYVKLTSMHETYRTKLTNDRIVLKDTATVRDLCLQLDIPLKPIRLVFINGKQASIDSVLNNNDSVYILPRVIGGG